MLVDDMGERLLLCSRPRIWLVSSGPFRALVAGITASYFGADDTRHAVRQRLVDVPPVLLGYLSVMAVAVATALTTVFVVISMD